MKTKQISFKHVFCIGIIFMGATFVWMTLGSAMTSRSKNTCIKSKQDVSSLWGPQQEQAHPQVWYLSPTGKSGRKYIQPSSSGIDVKLHFTPKKKGLNWSRAYQADFSASYTIPNPTPIDQTVYVRFTLPSEESSYTDFTFSLGEDSAHIQSPRNGSIEQAIAIPAGQDIQLKVAYKSRGVDSWIYELDDMERIHNFRLHMKTNFADVDFPVGTSSPTNRTIQAKEEKASFDWSYPDVINPQDVGMDMPKILNPGPVASRITFFAPVSLLFFFAVLLIIGAVRGMNLHPMNYFFLAASFFAFQILFAYLVDILPLHLSFIIASIVSLLLVGCYISAVGGKKLLKVALPAQFAYLVLFSYSFFFDGLSGLTITVGAIATLAILMVYTAKTDWSAVFTAKKNKNVSTPPPLPPQEI